MYISIVMYISTVTYIIAFFVHLATERNRIAKYPSLVSTILTA